MPKGRVSVFISSLGDQQLQQLEEVARSIEAKLGDLVFRDSGRIWGFKYADPVQYDVDLVVQLEDYVKSPVRWDLCADGETRYRLHLVRARKPQATTPPREAKLLLRYALPRKHQEHIIGDLEEAYHTEWLPEHGPREARRLFWCHAIRSVAPMLWTGLRRSAIITAILGAAGWLRDRLG